MKATEFCYWLQGFFEINGIPATGLSLTQTEMVQRHLHLVFKHEIDPSYPNASALNAIHSSASYAAAKTAIPLNDDLPPKISSTEVCT